MSPLLVALAVVFFIALFSQFGLRLPARRAALWSAIAVFLVTAAVDPEVFRPITRLFHIELVSNFVLAVMVMFLFFQSVEHQADSARDARRIVELTASAAAATYPARPGVDVLVVLPCRDEEGALPEVLQRLGALTERDRGVAFCVVDDASRDGTPRLLAEKAQGSWVRHAAQVGVAGALRTGFLIADRLGAGSVVQCDADGQHPVEEIPRLVAEARSRGVDLLVGARGAGDASRGALRRLGGAIIAFALSIFGLGSRVTDPTSGFRCYSRRAVERLLGEMPEEYPEPESLALLAVGGLSLGELAVPMAPRRTGQSSLGAWSGARYVLKVIAALVALRLRTWAGARR